ncbi:unnamed protein product [Arabidopsis thaliana]|uniref:Uncharacterized protein n=1 Tax=Arabidopsis thaliana TaxID=3702 RepID=A0A654FNL2_ARATH|nr:unnamed protein product [Arabidopsis thaliana]
MTRMMLGAIVEEEERTILGNELKKLILLFQISKGAQKYSYVMKEGEDFLQYLLRVIDDDEKAPLSSHCLWIWFLVVPHRNSKTSVVAGYTVLKDLKIFINVWAINRDTKNWEEEGSKRV